MALQIELNEMETKDNNIYPTAYLRISNVGLKGENALVDLEAFANIETGDYARENRDVVIDGEFDVHPILPQSIIRSKNLTAPLYDVLKLAKVIDADSLKNACYLWLKENGYESAKDILEE